MNLLNVCRNEPNLNWFIRMDDFDYVELLNRLIVERVKMFVRVIKMICCLSGDINYSGEMQ